LKKQRHCSPTAASFTKLRDIDNDDAELGHVIVMSDNSLSAAASSS